jgi:hypothetical protein
MERLTGQSSKCPVCPSKWPVVTGIVLLNLDFDRSLEQTYELFVPAFPEDMSEESVLA